MKIDELTNVYLPLVNPLIAAANGTTYQALFLKPNVAGFGTNTHIECLYDVRSVYLWGILERSHLTCMTYLARASQWLTAASIAMREDSLLGFASGLRGHLESAADAFDVLQYLPNTLTKSMRYAFLALEHPADLGPDFVNFGPLEDALIHYAYARGKTALNDPPEHKKKSSGTYNEQLTKFGVPRVHELYGTLCELVHPAAPSVLCFLDEERGSLVFSANRDRELIAEIASEYEDTIQQMTQYTLNSALISLSLLQRLNRTWVAATDEQMKGVGNVAVRLAAFDKFAGNYQAGQVDRMEIFRELS